jgi:hypothetical protein
MGAVILDAKEAELPRRHRRSTPPQQWMRDWTCLQWKDGAYGTYDANDMQVCVLQYMEAVPQGYLRMVTKYSC